MTRWVPPGWAPANPPNDLRADGKVASQYGCGVALIVVIVVLVIAAAFVWVMVSPP